MLELVNIHKNYENHSLLDGVSLTVSAREIVCLLGPSGSGKSTLLRIITGLEQPEEGQVFWGGTDLASIPVHQRQFGLMFQDYALFPHLTVAGNVSFGPRMQSLEKKEIENRVAEALKKTNLEGLENRRVTSLSGGEQQRVALARSLASKPRLLMFDEPLGALDRALKDELLANIRGILHEKGIPAIYVTHDQEEAFSIADRLMILSNGKIVQTGIPEEVFSHPASIWVARFLGAGNILEGSIRSRDENGWLVVTRMGDFVAMCDHTHKPGERVNLLLNRSLARRTPDGRIRGEVVDVVFQKTGYKVTLKEGFIFFLPDAPRVGEILRLEMTATGIQCLP